MLKDSCFNTIGITVIRSSFKGNTAITLDESMKRRWIGIHDIVCLIYDHKCTFEFDWILQSIIALCCWDANLVCDSSTLEVMPHVSKICLATLHQIFVRENNDNFGVHPRLETKVSHWCDDPRLTLSRWYDPYLSLLRIWRSECILCCSKLSFIWSTVDRIEHEANHRVSLSQITC